jgi:arginine repressor
MLYRSRHDPSRLSAALFDRVAPVVHAERIGVLTDPGLAQLLARLLDDYDFQLLDV